jgi:uncharacterized Zn-binding protein involved in type VI secretion
MANNVTLGHMWAGICVCHKTPVGMAGFVITGSGDVIAEGSGKARLGDLTIGFCGHVGVIVSGSGISIVNGMPDARLGDAVAGCNIGALITSTATITTE